MPVTVMRVDSAEKHPNADTLRVYELVSVDNCRITIVANLTNVYEVGDHAIIAQLGSTMKEDGLYIQEIKLRGLTSSGMMIGKTELPLGTDLTEEYCLSIYHVSWPDIESLFNVRRALKETNTECVVQYISKNKMDGSNSAIQIHPDGKLVAQNRAEILTPEQDFQGFAKWVEANREFFSKKVNKPVIVYGEWMTNPKTHKKCFFPFTIQYEGNIFEIHPKAIENFLGSHDEIFVLPFFKEVTLDFTNEEELEKQVAIINQWIVEIEACDPYLKSTFGENKVGEGLVFYPIGIGPTPETSYAPKADSLQITRAYYKDFVFKAKSEKHQVVKNKQPVQIDPEVAKNAADFADLFVTENRLNQFAAKIGNFDVKKTGQFLKEFVADVIKESKAELESSKLTWKDVSGAVTNKARFWWLEKSNISETKD